MIETENLLLRRPEIDDLDAIHAMRSDLDVVRFLGARALSREEAWHRLTRLVGQWALRGYGMFAVVEKSSGTLVGEVGLFDGCRGLSPDFDNAPEAGWILASAAHGKGYAGKRRPPRIAGSPRLMASAAASASSRPKILPPSAWRRSSATRASDRSSIRTGRW